MRQKETFQQKNDRRKLGRENGSTTQRRTARQLRRMLDGKFGIAKNAEWNDMIPGTTGEFRRSG